jgi:hypothetical protein
VLGRPVDPITCDKCGSALTDVDYDRKGMLVTRCPNRFEDMEAPLPPAS